MEIPYVKLPLIVIILLLVGLAVEFLILTIASAYALATLVGVPTLQLVIGAISTMSALASTSVAFLLYRNSVRGAEITIAIEDHLEPETQYRIQRNPPSDPSPAPVQLSECLHFEVGIVWQNTGPRSGAIGNVQLELVKPASRMATVRDGEVSEDYVSLLWSMETVEREEKIPVDSVKLPVFSWAVQNLMSIGGNESVPVAMTMSLFLMDKKNDVRPPMNAWLNILQNNNQLIFKIQWKTATKGKLIPNQRSFTIRPRITR